jgi:peptide methionine sulfoxide reductase MsrB
MSELINYNPDLIQRKIGVRESFESKCTWKKYGKKISDKKINYCKNYSTYNVNKDLYTRISLPCSVALVNLR